ncbi:DNA repair protein RecO [subsurface metagenome]
MLTKDLAICIRAVDYSETSQILTLFTRQAGKISAIAKGSKRPKSAFDGPIEVFSHGKIVFSDSNKEKLATLTEFEQQTGFSSLASNLFALNCCFFATELVDKLTNDYDPHPELFDSFLRFLQNTNEVRASLVRHSASEVGSIKHNRHSERSTAESRNLSLTDPSAALGVTARTGNERRDTLSLLILFQLSLLKEIGLQPILNACANCKSQYTIHNTQYDVYFSSSANGLICKDCEASFPDKIRLTQNAANCLSNLKLIAETDEKTLNEIERILIHHFTEILGRPPKMAKYILNN